MGRYSHVFNKAVDNFHQEFKNPSQAKTVLARGYSKVEDITERVMRLAKDNRDYILADTGSDEWKKLLNRYLDERTRKVKELVRMPLRVFRSMENLEQDEQIGGLEAVFYCMPEVSYDSIESLKRTIWGRMVLPWTYFSALTSKVATQRIQLNKLGKVFDFPEFIETLRDLIDVETSASGESILNYLYLKRRTLPGSFESAR